MSVYHRFKHPCPLCRLCDDLFKGIEERTKKKSAEDGGSALDIDLDGGGARVEFKVGFLSTSGLAWRWPCLALALPGAGLAWRVEPV